MNETLLAEDMKTTPKVAFVNKPYTQEERTKRDEEELEQLKKDCLLYTSPSPRDGLLSRMPSSA